MEKKNEKNKNKFFQLPKHSVSENYKLKINKVLNNLKKKAEFQFITASENNAWLFNIRGKILNMLQFPKLCFNGIKIKI